MQATRQDILDYLRRHGRASVKQLGEVLGLTSTGVRQHLNILERDGLIHTDEQRGRVGRPALVYSLTDKAQNLYPKNYALLANLLIEEVRCTQTGSGLLSLLDRVSQRMAEQHASRAENLPWRGRAELAAEVLREQGFEATCDRDGDDVVIRQYTCPFPEVAQRNSAVCAMDVNFIGRLTGCDARLTTSLLRGDPCCTYRLRPLATGTPSPERARAGASAGR